MRIDRLTISTLARGGTGYPVSLRGGKPGSWIEPLEPPLVVNAGKHERFKITQTESGCGWTAYIQIALLYADNLDLLLPATFLTL
ncbi:MAG: hypothetical protein ABSH32_31340 [Bryobacteraceae bacterium]|jgi:hypothetical protein